MTLEKPSIKWTMKCEQKRLPKHRGSIMLIKRNPKTQIPCQVLFGISIISHGREGNRLGARRWSLVIAWVRPPKISIMHQPNLNSDSDWVNTFNLKKIKFWFIIVTFHLVVLHMKFYLGYSKKYFTAWSLRLKCNMQNVLYNVLLMQAKAP